MLETECVGDKFEMLVADLIHWKITNITKKVAIIMNLSPLSEIRNDKVTNITVTVSKDYKKSEQGSQNFGRLLIKNNCACSV